MKAAGLLKVILAARSILCAALAFPMSAQMPMVASLPSESAAPKWHGAGAQQWSKMSGTLPRSYLCRRVNPAKPVSLADADIRTAEAWAHAPWTEDFVDIEGEVKEDTVVCPTID